MTILTGVGRIIEVSAAPPNLAYLDPGSGSFLLQLLAAGVLGGLFAARVFWRRIKRFLLRRPPRGDDEDLGE
jgi:hypothetical protein